MIPQTENQNYRLSPSLNYTQTYPIFFLMGKHTQSSPIAAYGWFQYFSLYPYTRDDKLVPFRLYLKNTQVQPI